jgi:hypothetical protein
MLGVDMVNEAKALMLSHSRSLFLSYTRNTLTSLKRDFKIHYEMTLHHTFNVQTRKHNTGRTNAIVYTNYEKKKLAYVVRH